MNPAPVNPPADAPPESADAPPSGPGAFARLPLLAKANLALLAGLIAALTALLWPHWSENPDLSHGYLMVPIFLVLLHESRSGTPRYVAAGGRTRLAVVALLALGLLSLCTGGLYAAALDWTHSVVPFVLTFALVFLLGGALLVFAADGVRLIRFNWTACVAIGLWLLSAPIPPGSYSRLTLSLQLAVTKSVLFSLHLLGIAANRQGNVIDLATTSVGVEDACSGIRSLISCVFAGFFFSATLVRRPWARAVVILAAAPLAIGMNFLRSLTLTLLANGGIDIAGTWHDVTGFAVLGITAALLAGLAHLLERSEPAGLRHPAPAAGHAGPAAFQAVLIAALAGAVALVVFFAGNTRPSIRRDAPVPDLAALLPAQAAGWRVETSTTIYQFSATLKTEHLAQRTYLRHTPDGVQQFTVYLAYWRAGQAPVSLVASHTPDACWPGSGWSPAGPAQSRENLAIAGRPLPNTEVRQFTNGLVPQYVWFWHLYDGRPITYRDPYSAGELLSIAWRYGFSHDGDQLFVRVSSNLPWSALAREPVVAEIFAHLRPLGL